MSADKSINKEDLPVPEKEQQNMQPEEYIQKKGNLEKDISGKEPLPGAPKPDNEPIGR